MAARACGLGIVLSSLLGGGAYAADLYTKAPPVPYVDADNFWTRPYLFGDLGRTKLKEMGISLALTLGDEAVGNVSGGNRNATANAGQLWFEAKFDMEKLVGIKGGMFAFTVVDRFGDNLNSEAGIPALQLTNEVYGRGNIARLTEFYWQQKLFDDEPATIFFLRFEQELHRRPAHAAVAQTVDEMDNNRGADQRRSGDHRVRIQK